MASKKVHETPGEYTCMGDGLRLCEAIQEKDINRIVDLDLSGDVVVVGYPKTGESHTDTSMLEIANMYNKAGVIGSDVIGQIVRLRM